jgi:hypothetical protein
MITVAGVSVPAPAGTVAVGPAFDFGPDGTTFAQPVTITLAYDASKIPAGRTSSDISIYTAPRGSTAYTALPTTVLSTTLVQTQTTHFTVYVPALPVAAVSGDLGPATDLGPPPIDFAMASSCTTPSCTATSGNGCDCTGTCAGQMIVLSCFPSTTGPPVGCFCEVNHATMPGPTPPPSSSLCSDVGGFWSKCIPAG